MKVTVNKLREAGYKVRITHSRRLRSPMIVPKSNQYPDGLDWCASKYEYEASQKAINNKWGENLCNEGGFTYAEIICPDGHVAKGKHNFNGVTYNRKIGRDIALGLAVKNAGQHFQLDNELAVAH
jgi:hypothetical protein